MTSRVRYTSISNIRISENQKGSKGTAVCGIASTKLQMVLLTCFWQPGESKTDIINKFEADFLFVERLLVDTYNRDLKHSHLLGIDNAAVVKYQSSHK